MVWIRSINNWNENELGEEIDVTLATIKGILGYA